jgi:hypothetical protein
MMMFAMGALLILAMDVPPEIPLPTKRPDHQAAETTPGPKSDEKHQSWSIPEKLLADTPIDTACISALKSLGVEFDQLPSVEGENGCGVAHPVNVTQIVNGVALTPSTELSCKAALAFAHWVNDALLPATRAYSQSDPLTGIRHASTYVCRTRNSQEGAKISEHATGNAIDVSAFVFGSGKTITIEPRDGTGSMEEAFQKSARFSACLYFTTVLGPISDEYHSDHLHFDIAERRGGYRLCRFPQLPNGDGE